MLTDAIQILASMVVPCLYVYLMMKQHKEVAFWKNEATRQSKFSDKMMVYVLKITLNECLKKEEYESAKSIQAHIDEIVSWNPDANNI